MPRHVRKGDQVMVTSGSFKGTVGEVIRVIVDKDNPDKTRVVVKGVNLQFKHQRPTRLNPQGSKFTKEASLHISKVSPVVDGKPVRVGFKTDKDGSKVRIARHAKKVVGELGKVYDAAKAKK